MAVDGIVAFANASFSALWQIGPDAIVGMTQADLHAHMLTDPEHDGHLLSIVSGQVCSTETNYIRLKNGKWRIQ